MSTVTVGCAEDTYFPIVDDAIHATEIQAGLLHSKIKDWVANNRQSINNENTSCVIFNIGKLVWKMMNFRNNEF